MRWDVSDLRALGDIEAIIDIDTQRGTVG